MSGSIMFGMNLKKERKKRKLTQQDLADRVGVSRKTISNYEVGCVDSISFLNIDSICYELGISRDVLFADC